MEMTGGSGRGVLKSDINVTLFVDGVLVLLILSIELTPLREQEPEAQLPEDSLEPLAPCMSASLCALEDEEEEMAAIAGGSECNPPGLAAVGAIVRRNQRILCTGTLIADDTILTAAHRIEGEDPATLSFTLGADSKMAVSFPIASGSPHPRYTQDKRGAYDIALLHLREPGDSLCKRFGLSARVDVAAEWIAKTASPSRAAPRLLSSGPEADFGGKRLAQQERLRSPP